MLDFGTILIDVLNFAGAVATVIMGGNLPPVSRRRKPLAVPAPRPVATLAVALPVETVDPAPVSAVVILPVATLAPVAPTVEPIKPAPVEETAAIVLPMKASKTAQDRRKGRKPLPMPSAAQSTVEPTPETLYVKAGRRYLPATDKDNGPRYRKSGDRYKLLK